MTTMTSETTNTAIVIQGQKIVQGQRDGKYKYLRHSTLKRAWAMARGEFRPTPTERTVLEMVGQGEWHRAMTDHGKTYKVLVDLGVIANGRIPANFAHELGISVAYFAPVETTDAQPITIRTLAESVARDAAEAGVTLTAAEQQLLRRMMSGTYTPTSSESAVLTALDQGNITRIENRLRHTYEVMATCGLVIGDRVNSAIAAELGYDTPDSQQAPDWRAAA